MFSVCDSLKCCMKQFSFNNENIPFELGEDILIKITFINLIIDHLLLWLNFNDFLGVRIFNKIWISLIYLLYLMTQQKSLPIQMWKFFSDPLLSPHLHFRLCHPCLSSHSYSSSGFIIKTTTPILKQELRNCVRHFILGGMMLAGAGGKSGGRKWSEGANRVKSEGEVVEKRWLDVRLWNFDFQKRIFKVLDVVFILNLYKPGI